MDLAALEAELTTDPLGRGYSGMTDQEVADSLNAENRNRDREIIETWEILEATSPSEWAALSAAEKQRYQTLTGVGRINVKAPNIRSALGAMFGAGTDTRTALVALQTESISRAQELGHRRPIDPAQVAQARTL